MVEYKVLSRRDKTFSGAFDPGEMEAALNLHAADGWRLVEGFLAASVWKRIRADVILILERPVDVGGRTR